MLSDKPQGTNKLVTHKLPEFRLSVPRFNLFQNALFFGSDFSYVHFYNEGGDYRDINSNQQFDEASDDYLKGHRIDILPRFSLPLKFQRFFEWVPECGLRETHWFLPIGDANKNRFMLDVASTLRTNVYRIFKVDGKKIQKVKHLIEPRLTHAFSPLISVDKVLPGFDGVDSISATHSIAWGLQNRLIFRELDAEQHASYFDGFRFDITQSFNILEQRKDNAEPKRPWGDVQSILSANAGGLVFNTEVDVNMYGDHVSRVSSGFQYSDPWTNVYRLNHTYSRKDEKNSINGGVGVHFFELLKFNFMLNYSFDEDRFLEKVYAATYFPNSKCWALNLNFTDRIDSGMAFHVGVNLLFGENFLSVARLYQAGESQNLRLLSGQGASKDLGDI